MKLRHYITCILLLSSLSLFAQSGSASKATSASETVPPDTSKHTFDHKMKDAYIGLGFVLGNSNAGAAVKYGESREFIIGTGLGYRFVKWNGIGVDIYYKSTGFFLSQDSTKILPDNTLHNSEKISFDNFGGEVFDRFFIGPVFLDGGFYFDWTFYTKHITWDNHAVANTSGGSSTKSIDRQLVFTNSTNYGLVFRLGRGTGTSLYFNYRMSKLFKKNPLAVTDIPELPVYVLGLTLGLHD